MRTTRGRRAALTVLLLLGLLAVPTSRPADAAPACGRLDRPETGLQGEVPLADQLSGRAEHGYNCGLALVGHTALPGASANMAWAGHCAFVATTGTGINVIDVSDPRKPVVTTTLHGPGSDLDDRDARGEAGRIPCRARRGPLRARVGRARRRADGHLRRVGLCPPAVPHDVHLPGQHPQPDDLARRQPGVRHVAAAGRRHPRSGAPGVPRQPRGGHPPTERAPGGGSPGELPGARGADEPGREHPVPGRADTAVRLVHDRRHHGLAGSHAQGAESGRGPRPLGPPGDDQRPEVRAPLRGEHRRADREGLPAVGPQPVRRCGRAMVERRERPEAPASCG